MKFAKNKTLGWIGEQEDQDSLIKFAMTRAQEMMEKKKKRAARTAEVIAKRAIEVRTKRDKVVRNKVEKELRKLLGKEVTIEQLRGIHADITEEMFAIIGPILAKPASLVGRHLLHTWTEDDGTDSVYNGQVLKATKSATVLSIAYWKPQETADDAVDFNIQVKQLTTDILFNELEFLD